MTVLPPKRGKRLACWLGLVALALLTIPVLHFCSSSRVETELARLRAQGILLTREQLTPTVPPGHRNAADLYQQAFQAMRLRDVDERRLFVTMPYCELIWRSPISDWDPAVLDLARRTVAGSEAAVELLTRASKVPDCAFALDWTTDLLHCRTALPFPEVDQSWILLVLRMRLLAHEGKGEAALKEYETALRMAHHLSQGTGGLTNYGSFYSHPTQALQSVLSTHDPSSARCRELFARLGTIDLVPAAVRHEQFALLSRLALFD